MHRDPASFGITHIHDVPRFDFMTWCPHEDSTGMPSIERDALYREFVRKAAECLTEAEPPGGGTRRAVSVLEHGRVRLPPFVRLQKLRYLWRRSKPSLPVNRRLT